MRLCHHHSEELDGSVDVTEPAAVKCEEDGRLGDHGGPVTDPGTEGGHRRTWRSRVSNINESNVNNSKLNESNINVSNINESNINEPNINESTCPLCLHVSEHAIVLTVNHGDHAVLCRLAGRPIRDDLHGDGVAFVGLQLGDEVGGGVSAGAA